MKQFNLFNNLSDGARRGSTLGLLSTLSRHCLDLLSVDLASPAVFPFRSQKSIGFSTIKSRSLFAKIAAVLCVLVTIGVENVWGAVTPLSLPKTWAATDGKDAYTEALGCTQSGLGTDYSASGTYLKFDNTGDYLIIQLADAPLKLTYNIKSNSFSGGTFKVQQSADGSSYTDVVSYTSISDGSKEHDLASTTRYIKFIYTTKSSGNVGLGTIGISKNVTYTVTWYKNGEVTTAGSPTNAVLAGNKVTTLPTAPTSSDCDGKVFVGWSDRTITGTTDTKPSVLFSDASSSPAITGNTNFYAVFATEGEEDITTTFNFDGATLGTGGYKDTDFEWQGITFKRSQMYYNNSGAQVKGGANGFWNTEAFPGAIKEIKVTTTQNNATLYTGTSAKATTSNNSITTGGERTFSISTANNYRYFYIKPESSYIVITTLKVKYVGTTYSAYATSCCSALDDINGTVSWTNAATAVVSWDNIANVSSWTVKYKTHSAGGWSTWAGDQTVYTKSTTNDSRKVTITGLTHCTDYDFQIIATPASGYCNKSETIEDDQTHVFTYTVTKTNVSLKGGEDEEANACEDFEAVYVANSGYLLPGSITVTNAGEEGTGWMYDDSDGSILVDKTYVTGNVTITITGAVASNFVNGKTVFIQAESSSAWNDNACVKAWFNNNGAGGAAQTTYWLYDGTGGNANKKLFATIVPASGELNQVTLQRFASNCSEFWNNNGTLTKASDGGSNTFRTTGSGTSNVAWNATGVTLYLYGDPNSWASGLTTFADQGAGVWTATYNNYTPSVTSADFKIFASYNDWIGNTGSNNNATLSGMIVGSKYDVTATLNITDHSLVMSKTFVSGTVHFDMQGHGSAISDLTNVTANSKISAPSPAPTATGYTFGGWYKEAGCTNAWNFASDEVTETMSLYAKWTPDTTIITLKSHWTPATNGSAKVAYDATSLTSIVHASRSGYDIAGYWTTEQTGGVQVLDADGEFISDNVASYVTSGKWSNASAAIDLWARWACGDTIKLTIGAESNGTTSLSRTAIETCNSVATARQVTLTATPSSGYEVTNIVYTGAGKAELTMVSESVSAGVVTREYEFAQGIGGNGTFTVTYTALPNYTVTWDAAGSTSTSSVQKGSKPTFPSPNPNSCDATSTTFVGWATAPWTGKIDDLAGKTVYTSADAMLAVTGNVTYYAVWAKGGGGSSVLFREEFSNCDGTGGNDGSWSGNIATNTLNTDSTGWTMTSGKGADHCAKFAANSATGIAVTPAIDCGTNTSATLTYKAGSWSGDGTSLTITGNNCSVSGDINPTLSNASFTIYTVNITNISDDINITFTGSGNKKRFFLDSVVVSVAGGGYEEYVTTCCDEVTVPVVTATKRSTTLTLSWPAVANAVSYEVACNDINTWAITGTSTKSCTITGLTPGGSYTYNVKVNGSTCFVTASGSVTLPDCDDSPILTGVAATATSASISWTCEAATATVQVFSDAECTEQVGSDYTGKTSPFEVSGLTSGTTYYYKVKSGGTCSSEIGTFDTETLHMDVAEWRDTAVVISFNGDANATLTTYGEVEHGGAGSNVAEDIFFSKYFESAGAVKLLGVFNGTSSTVNLSEYTLAIAQGSGATQAFTGHKFKNIVKTGGGGLSSDQLNLDPGEELILISYTASDPDPDIIKCAEEDEENSHFSSYVRISTPGLNFSGDDPIALINEDSTAFIDLIGAGTFAGGATRANTETHYSFQDKPGWFSTENGAYQALDGNEEAANYNLSTNHCLLIRRNHVKSGHIAVELNTTDFVTLSNHTYDAKSRQGEWKGVQVSHTGAAGVSESCDGFHQVGGYDYDEYYTTMDTVKQEKTFEDMKSDPFDGTYVIPVAHLDTLACKSVRIELKDGSGNLIVTKDFKVPIMVYDSKATTSEIFNNYGKTPAKCATCDVVVMKDAVLTKAADGTANDVPIVRNLEVYPGGKLVIPSGAGYNYTVNSIALRRDGEELSMLDVQGGLTVNKTKGVSLDLRIDPQDWHFVALPFACNVNDITYSDGTPAVLGTDYYLMWYDGAERAANKSGGWKSITAGTTIEKGMGFIVGLPDNPNGNIKEELRFPMANDVIADEKTDKTITGVKAHGGDQSDAELTPNHKGWNLIGNPYMMYYATDYTEPLMVGQLDKDGETYTRTGSARYLVTPNGWNGRNGYSQVPISTHMKPFTAYFVQIGGADNAEGGDNPSTSQDIIFTQSSAGKSLIIRRSAASYEEVDNHPIWFGIELYSPNGKHDETTLLMSDDFTDNYDMMDDLVKLRSNYYKYNTSPLLATRNNNEELAFNALPDSSAEVVGVPVNYYAAQAGYHTIALNGMYRLDEVKEAKLYDATTGKYHDLLTDGNYEFNTAKGDNNSRFRLFVRVERKQTEVTTDNDNLLVDGELSLTAIDHTLLLSGLTDDANVYVYDMSGKLLKSDKAGGNGAVWRANVPAAGVYFVRVNGAQGQQTLRTIVK